MKRNSTLSLTLIAMFAALTAVGAFIKIPIPYVPFTLQILFVYLAGSLLGSKRGFQSQLVYVAVGLAGLPVFTSGAGIGYVLQPTFGYLIGFMFAAFVVGWIIEKIKEPKTIHFILVNFVGLFVVYLFGVPYIYLSLNLFLDVPTSFTHVFMIGFVYAIGGDIILSILTGMLARRLYPVFQKAREQKKIEIRKEQII